MFPEPESKDQKPVPAVGTMAVSVAEEEQSVWLMPPLAVRGSSLVIVTVAVACGQLPLLTVHKSRLSPPPRPVNADEKLFAEEIVALPEITDQRPVPAEGALADKVADVAQRV